MLRSAFLIIDIVGTASIVPELSALWPALAGSAVHGGTLARAGRSARIGARLGRLVRLFKFQEAEPEFGPNGNKLEPRPSEVGHVVADKISSRVVILVMALIILLPLLAYNPSAQHQRLGLKLFNKLHADPDAAEINAYMEWYNMCDFDRCARNEELVAFTSQIATVDLVAEDPEAYGRYRAGEFQEFTFEKDSANGFEARFQVYGRLRLQGAWNLVFLIVAVSLFTFGAMTFLHDIQEYIISPIERLKALCDNLSETLVFLAGEDVEEQGGDEVEFLDQAVQKMEGLLRVGYGDAGTEIIARNLRGTSEKVDPMLPGAKIDGVCAFVVLVDFGFVTQHLNEKIMLYANLVGEVVHKCVVKSGGSPNKNMGPAILCMWKGAALSVMADGALKAMQEAMDAVKTHQGLNELIKDCASLQKARPGFEVRLKAGLHTGWVIEGAVGSTHKIDASYLSPHVNMTARIETASFQFGVPILLSEVFYGLLPKDTQQGLRKLDRVLVKGSKQPMLLWAPTLGDPEYTRTYCDAVGAYVDGDWSACYDGLTGCLKKTPGDQAAKTLLEYMDSAKQSESAGKPVAPSDWQGCRALTIK
eukprot:COSAG03_NODE_67_length_15062_cov_86.408781_2_plen_589_part_00